MTVTLLAHGSPDARHARDVSALAGRLKRAGLHAQVAYLDHHAPTPAQAARTLVASGARSTTVVPLLVGAAHQARIDVPAAVRAMRASAPQLQVAVAEPIGLHPKLLEACAEIAESSGLPIGDRTGIVVAAAGARDVRSPAMAHLVRQHAPELVDRLGARAVRTAYLDGGRPMGCIRTLLSRVDGCTSFVVVAAVVADGPLRDRIVAAAQRHDLPVAPGVLGGTNAVADLVALRAGAAPPGAVAALAPAVARSATG